MLKALTLLFTCQLVGETIVRALGIPFPGPVIGMGLLLAVLLARGSIWPELDGVADTVLRNLSLLFVPAAVGVMQQAGLLAAHWLVIALAIATSTVLTLTVTVLTFRAVARLQGGGRS